MEVKECIKSLYAQVPLENGTNVGDGLFYEFINKKLEAFIDTVTQIDTDSLQKILKSDNAIAHFVEPYTKLRFIHCMKKVCKDFLQILALCYKGKLTDADRTLKRLLRSRCYSKYLVEDYIEHFSFCLEKGKEYYRMRDENKCDTKGNELIVDNCWHVPYEKRAFAFSGRYNLLGYPCLYLGDSKETCEAELGPLDKTRRWVGVFGLKRDVLLYDLRIPSEEMIDAAEGYEKFRMLLTYPLIAACTAKSRRKGFNEEYFMPQLLFHQILMAGNKETSHKGIVYSSTKHKGGYNTCSRHYMPAKNLRHPDTAKCCWKCLNSKLLLYIKTNRTFPYKNNKTMLDLSVIILTYNEEIHIKRCLDGISPFVRDVFIIDCSSTDKTVEIARNYDNVTILQNKWINYATQFNWGLQHAPIRTKWVLRLDADEYLTDELKKELVDRLPGLPSRYTGVIFPLRRVFLGRTIRKGMPKVKLLRLFQYGKARSEVRLMDEHIQLSEGEPIEFRNEFADDNLNNLSWWSRKHVGYAIREAVDLLDIEFDLTGAAETDGNKNISRQAQSKRMKKHKYARQPLFWRSFAYFCYRYFFRLGFMEGKEGFLWHFLQGWWYRTLVDAKVYEIKKTCGNDREKIRTLLKEEYGIETELLNTIKPGGVIFRGIFSRKADRRLQQAA